MTRASAAAHPSAAALRSSLLDGARAWVARLPAPAFALYAGLVSFGTYSAMYAFRKPFAAASFAGVSALGAVEYKTALVIAQVVGYAIAKLIGVKVIAELAPRRRAIGIVAQVALAEAALVGFALVPPPWNIACLFADASRSAWCGGWCSASSKAVVSPTLSARCCARVSSCRRAWSNRSARR